MAGVSLIEIASDLWTAARGSAPTGGEEWRAFVDKVEKLLAEHRSRTITEAHVAVYSYQPIPSDGMAPMYRTAYEATVKGCGNAVLGLLKKGA